MSTSEGTKKKNSTELAEKAAEAYGNGDYALALETLLKIEKTITDKEDPRFLHNMRLAESASGGFTQVPALREGLRAVKAKIRARQAAKQGNGDSQAAVASVAGAGASSASAIPTVSGTAAATVGTTGSPAGPVGRGRNLPGSLGADVGDSLALLHDADGDCSILLYNLAALHMEQQEYGAARAILEHLFRHVERIEEPVAVYVCLLLLDVLVHCSRGAVLTEKDRAAFSAQTEEVLAHMEVIAGGKAETAEGLVLSPEHAADVEFRLHLYRARASLMIHQLKAAKKEIKSALELLQRTKLDVKVSAKAASEEKWSPTAQRNMTALYLKANFEYLRQNYRKALKLLSSCHTSGAMLQQLQGPDAADSSGPTSALALKGAVGALYYNNVGCVHHKMQRYHAALLYFEKAIKEGQASSGGQSSGLSPDGRLRTDLTAEVCYNAGLELLLTGRPEAALSRFEDAAALLYDRPTLWLRMAECCIDHHTRAAGGGVSVGATVFGTGLTRRFVLPVGPSGAGGDQASAERGKCSLAYAATCLTNVLFLVGAAAAAAARKEGSSADGKLGLFGRKPASADKDGAGAVVAAADKAPAPEKSSVDKSGEERELEEGDVLTVEAAALLCLSFVHLGLGSPSVAATYASKVLECRGVPAAQRTLARMYAAEALCALNKPHEAMEQLMPDLNAAGRDAEAPLEAAVKSAPLGRVLGGRDAAGVRAAMHVNLSTAFALQGTHGALKQAEQCARLAVAACPGDLDARRSLVYILLRTGQTVEAREWLKLNRSS